MYSYLVCKLNVRGVLAGGRQRGRFAGSSGAVPGTPGVDKVIQQMKTTPKYNGYEVIGTEISVKSSDGTLSRYDIVVRKLTGIEVKSGSATNRMTLNSTNGGLPTTSMKAKDAGITRIDSVELLTF